MDNLGSKILLDQIVDDAMLSRGVPLSYIQANGGKSRSVVGFKRARQLPRWTAEEDEILRARLGELSYKQVGDLLGRTASAVEVRSKRLQIGGPSKRPGYLSLNKASKLIGCDVHKLSGWVQHGIMQGQPALTDAGFITLVNFEYLKSWLTRPQHWPYFKVERMLPGYLKDLVVKAKSRWGDEWLTMRQMADMHGVKDVQVVSRTVMNGSYPGIKCPFIGGRNTASWSFWFVRKSVAEKWIRPTQQDPTLRWVTPAARDFMLRMRSQGYNAIQIGRMMKRPGKTVGYLLNVFRKELPEDQAAEIFRVRTHRGKALGKRQVRL